MDGADRMLAAARRFEPAGAAQGVILTFDTQPMSAPPEGGVTVRISTEDGRLVLRETLPDDQIAGWIDALTDVLELPNADDLTPDEWRDHAAAVFQLRRDLDQLHPRLD